MTTRTATEVAPPAETFQVEIANSNLTPGATVRLTYPGSNQRGGFYLLYRWNGEVWGPPVIQLESDQNGEPMQPRTLDTGPRSDDDDPPWTVEDYGVSGVGPDLVVLPETLEAGFWRICNTSRGENCPQFSVST